MEILNSFIDWEECNPLQKVFEWGTDLVTYDSGTEQRNQIRTTPKRHWFLNWSILPKANRDKLIELFQRAAGRYRTFRFLDAEEYQGSCTIPDSTTSYQLRTTHYSGEDEGWPENCLRIVNGTPAITGCTENCPTPANNTQFCVNDDTGIITIGGTGFASPKVCTFEYYFVVRFNFDSHTDKHIHPDIYAAENLEIIEVK